MKRKELDEIGAIRVNLYSAGIDFRRQNLTVYRRQILTSKVDPRAVRANPYSAGINFRRRRQNYVDIRY